MKIEIVSDANLPAGHYGARAELVENTLYLTVDPELDYETAAYGVVVA